MTLPLIVVEKGARGCGGSWIKVSEQMGSRAEPRGRSYCQQIAWGTLTFIRPTARTQERTFLPHGARTGNPHSLTWKELAARPPHGCKPLSPTGPSLSPAVFILCCPGSCSVQPGFSSALTAHLFPAIETARDFGLGIC